MKPKFNKECLYCHKEFQVSESRLRIKCCSQSCAVLLRMREKGAPMQGKKQSEETKKKISAYQQNNPRDIKFYKKIGLQGLLQQQNNKQPTSIEKKVYAELKKRGLLFERQYLVNGKFLVDAYIPSLNLIIEADGKYWHSLPKVQKKDKAENAYLTKCGFNLLRFSEEEIKNDSFKERMVN